MLAVPTIHPAYLIRSADGTAGSAKFEDTCIADLARAVEYTKRKPVWDESIIWRRDGHGRLVNLFPTLDECVEYFKRNYQKLNAVDIETTGEQPLDCQILCVGFASETGDAICVPILQPGGADYWSEDDKQTIWRMMGYFLASRSTPKVFQNGSFDTIVLGSWGLPVDGWDHDTMAAHHVLDGELPHSLAYIGSRYTEVPYYKDEVKGDVRWIDKDAETLRSYNIRDVLATVRAIGPLEAELKRWELWSLYQDELKITKIFVKATLRGILIDPESRESEALACPIDWKKIKKAHEAGKKYETAPEPYGLTPRLVEKRDRCLAELRRLAGHESFNPASVSRQLKWFLFDHLKFPVVKKTKKGAPSTDKEAMILLALHTKPGTDQEKALKTLIEWRQAEKLLGTSIRGMPPHRVTGRIHASWKLLPVTGRLSSSPNMQNWNSKVKRMMRAPEGSKYVAIDLSQAELRGISYFADDIEVLKMYERNINIHTVNATLIFRIRNPQEGDYTNQATEDYLTEAVPRLLRDPKTHQPLQYADFPVMPDKLWKRTRRLAKSFRFGWQYGAIAETIYTVLRSERDPDTNEPIFPDLDLATVELAKIQTEQLSKAIPLYWARMNEHVEKLGHFRTPLSGRIRWFRAGKKSNEIVNFPIQSLVADWMNKCIIDIDRRLEEETGGAAVIVLQVHDSLVVECPDEWVHVVETILVQELSKTFKLRHYENATLPPDNTTVGIWLDEV
jgi:DNA polymerase I-like protein with 3'-5' exonuclease and polymerase domains